jgi:hypothetical protein
VSAREPAGGTPLRAAAGLLWIVALTGPAYATVAYGLFRFFEREGRRNASLDTY